MENQERWQKIVGEECFKRLLASEGHSRILNEGASDIPELRQTHIAAVWEQIELYMELAYRVTIYARERLQSGTMTAYEVLCLKSDRRSALEAMLSWITYYRDTLGNPKEYIGDASNPLNYVFTPTGREALALALRVNMTDVGPALENLLRESMTPTEELRA